MINTITKNLEQLKKLGLDHVKFATEDEGLNQAELVQRVKFIQNQNLPVWVKIYVSYALEAKKVCHKHSQIFAVGCGIIPSTVNKIIANYQPNYIQTRNFCFNVNNLLSPKKLTIRFALETEILLLEHFGAWNAKERIKKLKERIKQ